ncbi:MAG: EAL domain-containing protein [Acidobacteria bacterium]|nr:EAL domain-containing protein [Acidobacteriota bacterium]
MPEPATILVVDDDAEIRLILDTLLSSAGFRVKQAGDGTAALEMASRERPDLVILDALMPRLSGWEVCATLKSQPETRGIPILLLTVKSEIRDLIASMQVGADDYVTKPFTKSRLFESVHRLLATRGASPEPQLPRELSDQRMRRLLSDSVSGLPTVPVVVDALRDRVLVDQQIGVIFVDVEKYSHIEDFYGWEVFDDVLREAARTLRRLLGTVFSAEDLVAINRPSGSEFYVFLTLSPSLSSEEIQVRLRKKARQLEETLRQQLTERFLNRIHRQIGLYAGFASIKYNPQVRFERLVYRSLREAQLVASRKEGERSVLLQEQFRDILAHERIATVYQPILDLRTGSVFAYEALSRGPAQSTFESPEFLFEYALKTEQIFGLEKLCLGFSARRFRGFPEGMLFVNMETELIHHLQAAGESVLEPLLEVPSGVVIEITERAAIRDYRLFRQSVSLLRDLGFKIAIDDAGSGYASLQSIAEVRPNFLKISNYLVSGLHQDTLKREVVDMLQHLAVKIDAKTVAEGIEREEELEELRGLGIDFGQGFLLGRPAAPNAPESN